MPEQDRFKQIKRIRFMTQVSNTPEEQPKIGKYTLADTDNLQVIANDSTLVNTKVSSKENPEATKQESVNKTTIPHTKGITSSSHLKRHRES